MRKDHEERKVDSKILTELNQNSREYFKFFDILLKCLLGFITSKKAGLIINLYDVRSFTWAVSDLFVYWAIRDFNYDYLCGCSLSNW